MTNIKTSPPAAGLEGVVATSSTICDIDGAKGVLAYCGYDIHELAQHATFEEVCFLLWHRRLPTRGELGDLQSQLAAARLLPDGIIRLMRSLPIDMSTDAMGGLRTLVSALSHFDGEAEDDSSESRYRQAVRLTARMGSLVATYGRLSAGANMVEPDPVIGHAANFLLMLNGTRPTAVEARALDVALILHADHELNASTFAGRVTAATLSDLYSSIVAGVGALKGPLHGGANAAVMQMLLGIGEDADNDRVDELIREKLRKKEKVPGFGHRVYRTEDPRATHLRRMSQEVGERTGNNRWFEISQRIEAVMKTEKQLDANVDFYSASTYYLLGIPIALFTPLFAVSRVSGWTAHVLEQYSNNRLIRPRAEYIGLEYPQAYVQLARR